MVQSSNLLGFKLNGMTIYDVYLELFLNVSFSRTLENTVSATSNDRVELWLRKIITSYQ